MRFPRVLYDLSEYAAVGERVLLPKHRAREALASLRKDLGWKVSLNELPKLIHINGPIYTDGKGRYRVRRLERPYDPGTYTVEPW